MQSGDASAPRTFESIPVHTYLTYRKKQVRNQKTTQPPFAAHNKPGVSNYMHKQSRSTDTYLAPHLRRWLGQNCTAQERCGEKSQVLPPVAC